ncbi:MAG: hypothetical protein ACOX5T_07130, partial [Candidatus Cryptobacteroides sp.]
PCRTEQLSPPSPMVLVLAAGRAGSRRPLPGARGIREMPRAPFFIILSHFSLTGESGGERYRTIPG